MPIDYTKRPAAAGGTPPKVVLSKSAPSVSLTKQSGLLRVNLNWNAVPAGGLSKGRRIDLDLGCLWRLTDRRGVVQALGNAFTVPGPGGKPVIWLDGDDRSGDNAAGENLFVDLSQVHLIEKVLVFTYIYEGTPNWAEADAVVTLHPASGPRIEVRLDESDQTARTCAIAMLENVGGELAVRREVRYIQGAQEALSNAYGWDLRWQPARK
jgi:tellurite resistance protein TerA